MFVYIYDFIPSRQKFRLPYQGKPLEQRYPVLSSSVKFQSLPYEMQKGLSVILPRQPKELRSIFKSYTFEEGLNLFFIFIKKKKHSIMLKI